MERTQPHISTAGFFEINIFTDDIDHIESVLDLINFIFRDHHISFIRTLIAPLNIQRICLIMLSKAP